MPPLLAAEPQAEAAPTAPTTPQRPLQQPLPQAQPHSAFVPVLMCALALLAGLGWQTYLLASERDALTAAHAGQQQTVDNASKLRASLDTLAADTQRLADGGNASAALLVAELKKRGITINPKAGAAAEAGAAAPVVTPTR